MRGREHYADTGADTPPPGEIISFWYSYNNVAPGHQAVLVHASTRLQNLSRVLLKRQKGNVAWQL